MTTITLHDYLQQIEELIEEHRLSEAVDHCRHILQKYPRHIPTYRMLAKVFIEKGDHADAVDLLNRILSVDPNDFIAHVALSIAYKGLTDLPRSIYHLQRALDCEPYNAALWEELQESHALNKTIPPESMAPSSPALARLYLKSEMYAAAIAELRQLLAQNPDRIDLKVQLAEAVWWANQRVEAVSLALEILDVLPNCLSANAMLAEIWLQTGRKVEAQTYLKRLQEMTLVDKQHLEPETAVGRAFLVRGAPPVPDSITIDYYQDGGAQPIAEPGMETVDSDWISEFTLEDTDELAESSLSEDDADTDWLSAAAVPDEEEFDTQSLAQPSEPVEAETDWFVDPAQQDDESLDELLGDVGDDAQLDDWLSDLSGESTPEPAPEPGASGATGFTGLLGQLVEADDAAADEAEPAGMTDFFDDRMTETAVTGSDDWEAVSEEAEDSFAEGLTDLFDQIDEVEATAVASDAADEVDYDDFVAADLAALTESDEPDEADEHTGYTQLFDELSIDAFPEEPAELDADWLSSTTDPLSFDESDESPAEEMPDWLAEVKDDEFEPVQIDNRLTSDWLVSPEEPEAAADEGDDAVESDWLADLAGEEPEAIADDTVESDWLADLAGEEPEAIADDSGDAVEESDWLADLAGEESPATAAESEPPAAEEPDIPTWMLGDEQSEQVFEASSPLDMVESEAYDTDELAEETAVPTWLLGDDQAMEETGGLESELPVDADLDTSQTTEDQPMAASGAELPDWLRDDRAEPEKPEAITEDPLSTDSMISLARDEIPDWLRDDEPEIDVKAIPELDSSPELFDDDEKIPDWLLADLSAGQTPAEASVPDDNDKRESIPQEPPEETPEPSSDVTDDDLDWLEQLAESPDAHKEDDSSSFASRIAAGEGGAVEEPPTQASLPDDAADMADEFDWLDSLSEPEITPTEEQVTLDWSQAEPEIEDMLAGVTGELDADFAGLDTLAEEPGAEPELTDDVLDELDSGTGWLDDLAVGNETGALEELGDEPSLPDFEDSLAALPEEEEADLSWLEALEQDVQPAEAMADVPPAAEVAETPDVFDDLTTEDDTWDLLEEIAAESPEAEIEAEEMLLPPTDDSLDWLEEMSEAPSGETADLGLSLETDDLPSLDAALDWLEPEDEPEESSDWDLDETPVSEAEPEEVAEDMDDAMIWLEELAAKQGASLEELPGVVTDEADDAPIDAEVPEDMDDAMAWLEQLAAKQGAPLEELPSVTEAESSEATSEPEVVESAAADLDDAMGWLEDLAAEQESPLEDLPTIAGIVDEGLTAVPPQPTADEAEAEVDEAADELSAALDWLEQLALEDGADLTGVVVEETAVSDSKEELAEALDWLEQLAQAEEKPATTDTAVDELADLADAMPEDPDEALAWLQQMAAAEEVALEEAEVGAETAVPPDTSQDTLPPQPDEIEPPVVPEEIEPEAEPEPYVTEETTSDDIEDDILSEMPEDPDAAMAWLERLAAKQGARLEELPTMSETDYPPEVDFAESEAIEPDELAEDLVDTAVPVADSLDWLDDLASEADETPAADLLKTGEIDEDVAPKPEEAVREADLTELEAPDNMDDAMAWLEALAAQQGAALEELPTLSGLPRTVPELPVEEPESPEPAEEDAGLNAEAVADTAGFDEAQVDEAIESEVMLPDADVFDDDEIDLTEDVAESLPDWLETDTSDLTQMAGQTQWLHSLDEPDITGWLEEEEVTLSSAHDRTVRTRYQVSPGFDTGPLTETGPLELPEEETIASVFALDDEKLTSARQAVENGAFGEAVQAYQSLVTAGGGLMTLIADLESVADEHQDQPLFRHLLGDAYMQNGQLQKALDTYRTALDQI